MWERTVLSGYTNLARGTAMSVNRTRVVCGSRYVSLWLWTKRDMRSKSTTMEGLHG